MEEELEEQQETDSEQTEDTAQSYQVGDNEYSQEQIEEAFQKSADFDNNENWKTENTRKSQEIADSRKELEKVQQLETMLRDHPDLYGQVESVFSDYQNKQEATQPQISPEVQEVRQIRDDIATEKELIQLKQDLGSLQSRSEYKEFFEADPELDRKVVKHALDNDIPNINAAFKDLMFDQIMTRTYTKGQQKKEESKQKARNLSTPSGSKSSGGKGGKRPTSMTELAEAMNNSDALNDL